MQRRPSRIRVNREICRSRYYYGWREYRLVRNCNRQINERASIGIDLTAWPHRVYLISKCFSRNPRRDRASYRDGLSLARSSKSKCAGRDGNIAQCLSRHVARSPRQRKTDRASHACRIGCRGSNGKRVRLKQRFITLNYLDLGRISDYSAPNFCLEALPQGKGSEQYSDEN